MGCVQHTSFPEAVLKFQSPPRKKDQDMTPFNIFYNLEILPFLQDPNSPRRPPSIDEEFLFDERVPSLRRDNYPSLLFPPFVDLTDRISGNSAFQSLKQVHLSQIFEYLSVFEQIDILPTLTLLSHKIIRFSDLLKNSFFREFGILKDFKEEQIYLRNCMLDYKLKMEELKEQRFQKLQSRSRNDSIDLNSTLAFDFRHLDGIEADPLFSNYFTKSRILKQLQKLRIHLSQPPDPIVMFGFNTSLGSSKLRHLYFCFVSNKVSYCSDQPPPGVITATTIEYRHHEVQNTVASAVHCFQHFLRKADLNLINDFKKEYTFQLLESNKIEQLLLKISSRETEFELPDDSDQDALRWLSGCNYFWKTIMKHLNAITNQHGKSTGCYDPTWFNFHFRNSKVLFRSILVKNSGEVYCPLKTFALLLHNDNIDVTKTLIYEEVRKWTELPTHFSEFIPPIREVVQKEEGQYCFFDQTLQTQNCSPLRLLAWGQFKLTSAALFMDLPQLVCSRYLSVVLIDAYDERTSFNLLAKGLANVEVPLVLPYGELLPNILEEY